MLLTDALDNYLELKNADVDEWLAKKNEDVAGYPTEVDGYGFKHYFTELQKAKDILNGCMWWLK